MRVARLTAVLASLLVSLLGAACSGSGSSGPDAAGGGDTGAVPVDVGALDGAATDVAPDEASTTDVPAPPHDVPPDGSASACPANCPEALCDEVTGRCLACVTTSDCLRGEWCRDGECVRTLCVPNVAACDGLDVIVCADDGLSYGAAQPCPENEHCTLGECLPVVCTPGDNACDDLQMTECNDAGTGWLTFPCQPGAVCREGEGCTPYRNTILLIFDTSGSMGGDPFGLSGGACVCGAGNCPAIGYPACEMPLCPRSKLGMSKYVFTQLFSIISTRNLHFVMTRFPQRVSRSQGDCNDMMGVGHYQPGLMDSTNITGDDDSHVPPYGSWYDLNLHEILSVPFPRTDADDTFAEARLWMNFNEEIAATGELCASDDDCANGFCDEDFVGNRVCHTHSDPELRATGNTPLGKSLFYAGEYLRKYVVVDGKTCATDEDCANVNYRCGPQGTCFDPLGHCRAATIILFTDGLEDPASEISSYFNPRVQAKRLRYGLGCTTDADCGSGATCSLGKCDGYPRPNGSGGGTVHPTDPNPGRLETHTGRDLEVIVHVVDMGEDSAGTSTNRAIADEGGGRYFSVRADNPQEFIDALLNITDIKQTLVCVPDWPAGFDE